MPYTMDDFVKEFVTEHFKDLSPEQQQRALEDLPPEVIPKVLSPKQLEYLERQREPKHASPEKARSSRKSQKRRKR